MVQKSNNCAILKKYLAVIVFVNLTIFRAPNLMNHMALPLFLYTEVEYVCQNKNYNNTKSDALFKIS